MKIYKSPQLNVTNVLFCSTKSPNKYIQLTITYNKEKHQILTFEKL